MRLFKSIKERFSRQSKAGYDQKKIGKQHCVVVGAGGLGSVVGLQLAMLGVKKISLVDMDNVETSNLNRQFFYEEDITSPKTEALSSKLKLLNSTIEIDTYNSKIEETNGLLKDATYVFDCLDNINTREYLNKECVEHNVPLIHAGCSDKIGEIQLILPKETACLGCNPYPEEMKKDKRSCGDFDPSIAPTNFIVASLQIDMFCNHLFGNSPKTFVSYIKDKSLSFGKVPKMKTCEVCAE